MARYRNYAGYCKKYGAGTMQMIAVGAPAAVLGAIACTPLVATHPLAALSTGVYGGAFGYIAGAFAHIHANRFASKRDMSMAAGGRLARAWQAVAYGATVTTFAAAGLILDPSTARDQQDITPRSPATHAVILAPPVP